MNLSCTPVIETGFTGVVSRFENSIAVDRSEGVRKWLRWSGSSWPTVGSRLLFLAQSTGGREGGGVSSNLRN